MRYGPWPRSGRLLRHLCCSSSLRRGANAEGAGVKAAAAHRAQRGLALTQERPAHYIALPWKEEEKRRSNRQPRQRLPGSWSSARPARRRQASWGIAGATGLPGPAAHSPASKRPIDLPPGAQRAAKPPRRGGWGERGSRGTGRAQRRRCLPLCAPWGADRGGKAQRPFERVAAPTGGRNSGLAAQPRAGAVQPWRRISGCTDRSAGGCADRRTLLTIRARAAAAYASLGRQPAERGGRRAAAAARGGAGGRGLEDRSPVWKGARAPCYACAETRPCEAQRDRVPDAPSADGTGCLTRIRLEG